MEIKENLKKVLNTLKPGVTLVAVSKTKPEQAIIQAYEAGQRDFGENRVQELVEKIDHLPQDIRWHFIGNLQRNKVKYLDERIYLIHSLDRASLAKELNKNAKKKGFIQNVLLEVNIGGEESKGGTAPKDLPKLIETVQKLSNLHVKGLMAMIPETSDVEQQQHYFKEMAEIFNKQKETSSSQFEMEILSMGMSGDYQAAMACGSTMVRVGSAIFGARAYL